MILKWSNLTILNYFTNSLGCIEKIIFFYRLYKVIFPDMQKLKAFHPRGFFILIFA